MVRQKRRRASPRSSASRAKIAQRAQSAARKNQSSQDALHLDRRHKINLVLSAMIAIVIIAIVTFSSANWPAAGQAYQARLESQNVHQLNRQILTTCEDCSVNVHLLDHGVQRILCDGDSLPVARAIFIAGDGNEKHLFANDLEFLNAKDLSSYAIGTVAVNGLRFPASACESS